MPPNSAQPGTHWLPSQTVLCGAHWLSMEHGPERLTQCPVVVSQTCPPWHIIPPGAEHPGTQARFEQIELGGLHPESFEQPLLLFGSSTHSPPMQICGLGQRSEERRVGEEC